MSNARLLIMAGDLRQVHVFLGGLPPMLRHVTGGPVWCYVPTTISAQGFVGELYAVKIGTWRDRPEAQELVDVLTHHLVTWVEPEDVAALPIFEPHV